MQHTHNKSYGFTLIELMITISVMAIIIMIAAPSFNNMLINENLKTTAFNMKDTLKEARSRAMLNRNEVIVCTSTNKLGIAVTQAQCGAGLTGYSTGMSSSLQESSVLISNVEKKIVVKASSADRFIFSPRGNLTTTQTITFCSSVGSYILTIGIPGTVDIAQGAAC